MVHQPEPHGGGRDTAEGVAALYRREYASMVRLAHLITGSNDAVEDAVQESFVRLHRNWERAQQPSIYLRAIVVNRCRTWQRRRILERDLAPQPPDEAVDPEVRELLDALARLDTRRRAALVLRFYGDLTEADIALALGCRPGTVTSLVHRGLRQLKGLSER